MFSCRKLLTSTLFCMAYWRIKAQNRLASRQHSVGDPVELVWDPGQTRLFPGER